MDNKDKDFCAICKNHHDFDLPNEIVEAAINSNLVIFAGAGISTENKRVFIETLYEEIKLDLKLPKIRILNSRI